MASGLARGALLVGLTAVLLMGCETTTTTPAVTTDPAPLSRNEAAAAKGLTQSMADQQYMQFAVARVMAESYAESCSGVSLIQINQWVAVGVFEATLREQGYSPTMIKIANNRVLRSRGELIYSAMQGLKKKGVRPEDKTALCNQARKEIAAKTAIGRHLKLG